MSLEEQLDQALAGLLQPDNAVIKTSRRFLVRFVKKQACVAGLMSRITLNAATVPVTANAGVRQIAAVLLHKYINKHWGRLGPSLQNQVQTALLHLLTQEPEPLVRRAIGSIISKLAKHLLPAWEDLLKLIIACSSQADPRYREQAMLLLYQTAEPIGRTLEAQFGGIAQLYTSALRDNDLRVRIMALKASCALVAFVSRSKHVMAFRDVIPLMYGVVAECANPNVGENTAAALGLECFVDLVLSPCPVLKGQVGSLCEFALGIGTNSQIDILLRDAALQVVVVLTEAKPRTMIKAGASSSLSGSGGGLVQKIVTAMFQMCMEVQGNTPLDGLNSSSVETATALASDFGTVDGDEDDEFDREKINQTPASIALYILDRVAIALPNKHVFPVAKDAAMAGIRSGTPEAMSAALFALASITEGCVAAMSESLPSLMTLILSHCANHGDTRVRGATCYLLSMLCMYASEAVMDAQNGYTKQILDMCLDLLRTDSRYYTRSKCLYLLEMLCDSGGETGLLVSAGYLQPIMTVAQAVLAAGVSYRGQQQTGVLGGTSGEAAQQAAKNSLDLSLKAVAVICSVAIACPGDDFAGYVDAVFPTLRALADDPAEEYSTLRGEAMQCIGHIAVAVGAARFGPAVIDVMQIASRCMQVDDPELFEYVFNFFGSMAECLGPQFAPFLDDLVPIMLDHCLSNNAVVAVPNRDSDLYGGQGPGLGEEDDEDIADDEDAGEDLGDEDTDDEDGMQYRARVRVGMMDLKEAAVVNIGRMAAAVVGYKIDPSAEQTTPDPKSNDPFLKWIDPTLNTMRRLTSYFQPEIRNKAIVTLRHIALSRWFLASGGEKHGGLGGQPIQRQSLPSNVASIVEAVIPLLLLRMNKDMSKTVVATCVETMEVFVRDMGSACIVGNVGGSDLDGVAQGQQTVRILDAVMHQVLLFLGGKAVCQDIENDDEEGDEYGVDMDGDEGDHDFVLMDSVTDLIGSLSRAIGPEFISYAIPLLHPIGRFLAPNRPHTDKSMAIGCYADIVSSIGPNLDASSTASLLQVGINGLADTSGRGEVQVSLTLFSNHIVKQTVFFKGSTSFWNHYLRGHANCMDADLNVFLLSTVYLLNSIIHREMHVF